MMASTMASILTRGMLSIAVLAAFLAVVGPLSEATSRLPQPALPEDDVPVILPSAAARSAALGFSAVEADYDWLRAIQYYGSFMSNEERNRGLVPLLREAASQDPDFGYLFQFAGQALPFRDQKTGNWYNTGVTIDLLERGVESRSNRWQIPWLLAYCLYTFRGDYADAGRYMQLAAERPKAPAYLHGMAIRLLAQGAQVQTAIEMTRSALSQAKEEKQRVALEDRLKSLRLQEALERLQTAARERSRLGLPINVISDLIGYSGLVRLPQDPFGGRFEWNSARKQVVTTSANHLLHLYVHPGEPAIEKAVN